MSVYAYMRKQKMEAAAAMLTESNDTVLSIAGKLGYENGSKFASAFKAVTGISPTQYRNIENS
jgi:AraC-like DNA-binding protein